MSANIERIANDAPQDISFITGLLRHATGICNKQDLPASTQQLVTADEPLHALEARILLNKVNETGTAEDRARPIGSFENDLRISKVIELINQRHGVELNLQLLEIRESGLNNAGIYSEMPGASKQLDQRHIIRAASQIGDPNQSCPATNGATVTQVAFWQVDHSGRQHVFVEPQCCQADE